MAHIHIIHENPEWTAPLFERLQARSLPCRDWNLAEGEIDLSEPPPHGVFYSRMSASAHTRGHRFAPEFATAVIHWLESHGRRVINGSRAIQLELSKVAQYAALNAAGIRTPRTLAVLGRDGLAAAAGRFDGPFITKHNRAGKGLGVHLFNDAGELAAHLAGSDYDPPVDGITLLQQYIEAPAPFITRVEFVGGELLYAVRVDTSAGFELCPADACAADAPQQLFRVITDFASPLVTRYREFLKVNRIQVAGIEFIVDGHGQAFTYDVNTNTNYNPAAEAAAGVAGLEAVTDYLGRELAEQQYRRPAAA